MAAGGINGLLFLPLEQVEDKALIYPVGTADFYQLFGRDFNATAFKETPQFLYMGALDDNDAVPYSDAFGGEEREVIYQALGRVMQPDRWINCQNVYDTAGVMTQFQTYPGIGHEQTAEIKNDILGFFKSQIVQ